MLSNTDAGASAPACAALRFAITIDRSRDELLTHFGKETLKDRYLLPGESYQDLFARVACAYADNADHAQRLYTYMSLLWFMPATPVLANGGTTRGLPISCYLNEVPDSLEGIDATFRENFWLAARGGGIGTDWSNVRSIGEKVGLVGETSGIMPFVKMMDSQTLAVAQGNLRRGSAATYLRIDHPEIEEFIDMRRPTGGDPNRRSLNLHHGVVVTDAFMRAVENDQGWNLVSPRDGSVQKSVSARDLWIKLLTARIETGEPYILFIDTVNNLAPETYKKNNLEVKTSNLCCEVTLVTGTDQFGNHRTNVCCLSSLNLDYFLDWSLHPTFIEDVMRFLDNVMQDFIDRAPDSMSRARYSAMRERSVGLGVMGFHSFLQKMGVPFESAIAKSWNLKMFKHIKAKVDEASVALAHEKGPCPDAADAGIMERFANKTAVAPTASISIICGGASPGIEPSAANSYVQKTLSGSHVVRNPHLKAVLAKYGRDDQETWVDIGARKGSVQHLDFLTDQERDVFKTAIELDQRWLIEHAADRTPFIDQGQSLNLFFAADAHKKDINAVHMMAWKKGVKGLYYCRSLSVQRAETVSEKIAQKPVDGAGEKKYDECLACQ
jgi:ribonucleoside-diphosphate reductase alpha chain